MVYDYNKFCLNINLISNNIVTPLCKPCTFEYNFNLPLNVQHLIKQIEWLELNESNAKWDVLITLQCSSK
jgi:hypothetical protein